MEEDYNLDILIDSSLLGLGREATEEHTSEEDISSYSSKERSADQSETGGAVVSQDI